MVKTEVWDTAQNRAAEAGIAEGTTDPQHADWLSLAQKAYQGSTDYVNANLRNQWQRNLRHFNNRHQTGSKYYSEDYKHRSKLFRPKTRSTVRRAEAYAAQAFFSTNDLVAVDPIDEDNPEQVASAAIDKELLNLRLDQKPIRWFPTLVGAYQDTKTQGICISKQWWEYEERVIKTEYVQKIDEATGMTIFDEAGEAIYEEVRTIEVIKDHPAIRLIAPENVRFDPGADWIDPVNTSPYFIELIPMYAGDVKERMRKIDPKTGQPIWFDLDDKHIHSARHFDYNSTRQARENYREDSKDTRGQVNDFDIVWVHENCIRKDGQDWIYFTLGNIALLSEPVRREEVYPQKERPWIIGYSNLEAHKTYPAAMAELVQDLQVEANEVANQRIDNVRLAMNPRYYVRRGGKVDLAALRRSVPGGPIMMENPTGPEADLTVDRPPEVTASSYAEQDRINSDYDDLAGNFSQSSVETNRKLNETVGGMKILQGGANTLNDYDLRLFTESWVEPVLRQIVNLIQHFETDTTLIVVAAKKAQLWKRYGINTITDEMLQGDFTLRVNVGIGATDPTQRLERFLTGAKAIGELLGESVAKDINKQEIAAEIFGILGYRDGDRFFLWSDDDDPRVTQLQQENEMLMKVIEEQQVEQQAKITLEKLKGQMGLEKQKMGDLTKVLIELLKQEGQGQAEDAEFARTSYQAAQQSREAEAGRNFQKSQSQADRFHQARESAANRESRAAEQQQRYAVQ